MLAVDIEKKLSVFTLKIHLEIDGRTALIGPSGCGKSVTLKCIAGIMKPDKGRIIHNGRTLFDSENHIDIPPQKRRIGYLFQNYALFPDMTVKENILTGLRWEKDKSRRLSILDDTAALLHIDNLMDSKPYELSGGEAQRTALARMIVNKPDLLLFDEPFSALDVFLKEEIKAEFKALMDKLDKDYIVVTHSMNEAYSLSDMMFIIDKGKVIRSGSTENVFAAPENIRAASIMGYRNITKAYEENGSIVIPGWNMKIPGSGKDIAAVAISENDIHPGNHGYKARITERITSPDSEMFGLMLEGGSEKLWMRCQKNHETETEELTISIEPESIKLLSSGEE